MQWIVGLDALRAIAMGLIVAYHFLHSSGILTGGFVLIEFFLLASGFLMTTKLLRDYRKTGEIKILSFILGRIGRFWPVVLLALVLSLCLANFTPHELLAGLRGDTLGAATFSTNILEIFSGKGYENTISPNLFENFWFVALDLQLCILLPIFLTLIFSTASRYRTAVRRSLIVCVLISIISAVLMGLYGGYWGKVERAYFAPDAQCFAFFLGAALALWRSLRPLEPRRRRFWAGVTLFVGSVGLIAESCVLRYGEQASFYWGMPLAAVLSLIVLDSLLILQCKRTVLPKFLRLLEYIGKYSFGIYLIHYPAMLLLARVVNIALPLRLIIVLMISFVTTALLNGLIVEIKQRHWLAVVPIVAMLAPAVLVLIAAPNESPIMQEISQNQSERAELSIRYVQDLDNSQLEQILHEAAENAGERAEPVENAPAMSPNDAKVLVIGDSVALGAKAEMESIIPDVYVNAEESRGIEKAVPILNQVAASGKIPQVVIVSLTTNERYFSDDLMQGIVDAARGSRVIFVTGYAGPDQPRETQNEAIRNFANSHDNVYYADWWQIAHDDWDLMYADHIHLDIEGRSVFAQLLYNTIMNTGGLE